MTDMDDEDTSSAKDKASSHAQDTNPFHSLNGRTQPDPTEMDTTNPFHALDTDKHISSSLADRPPRPHLPPPRSAPPTVASVDIKVAPGTGVNCRDVGFNVGIRPNVLFRSSMLFNLPNVKTVIDLRGDPEAANCGPVGSFHVPIKFISSYTGMKILGNLGVRTAFGAMFSKNPKKQLAEATFRDMGMAKLYQILVANCHKEMREALALIAEPHALPVVIHCIHGKDRTGVVTAIALLLCKVPPEIILDDYSKSSTNLCAAKSEFIPETSPMYLPDELIESKPQDMQSGVFDYLASYYTGSINGSVHEAAMLYAADIGLTKLQIEKIIDNLGCHSPAV